MSGVGGVIYLHLLHTTETKRNFSDFCASLLKSISIKAEGNSNTFSATTLNAA